MTTLFLEPPIGQPRESDLLIRRRRDPHALDRLMTCANGCGQKFRVGVGVTWIICGKPSCSLASVRGRIDREKRRG